MTRRGSSWISDGLTGLCAGALGVNLLLIIGLLGLLGAFGLGHFWQPDLAEIQLVDGGSVIGEVRQRERIPDYSVDAPAQGQAHRLHVRSGNRRLNGAAADFRWIDERQIKRIDHPPDLVRLDRLEWGPFFGRLLEVRRNGSPVASGAEAWPELRRQIARTRITRRRNERFASSRMQPLSRSIRKLELQRLEDAYRHPDDKQRLEEIDRRLNALSVRFRRAADELNSRSLRLERTSALLQSADGRTLELPVAAIVRAHRPNRMHLPAKLGLYMSRLREFVFDAPRESNTEGGIYPAIFGTVLMVFLMAVAVTPFGVLAAIFLAEYAGRGPLVRAVRIAVNNLAGVPSIVFGVFGLGFFVYLIGGGLDNWLFPERLPNPTFGTGGILWASLTLALLTVPVVIVATEEGLAAVPRSVREGSQALGATKFETTWRVVLPAATPGVLTGLILAMARAAGEVAPLMIVGMVKLASTMPVDGEFPFLHPDRKFMHLGFHIYDVGFQSPSVEASQSLVYATALLLVSVVVVMNLLAIGLRARLRARYRQNQR